MLSTFVDIMMINNLFIMCENLFDNIVPSTGSKLQQLMSPADT
jgi:hypothetical protein